jgi:hypothetical protein
MMARMPELPPSQTVDRDENSQHRQRSESAAMLGMVAGLVLLVVCAVSVIIDLHS